MPTSNRVLHALELVGAWPVGEAAAGVLVAGQVVATTGATERVFPLASVSKLITAWAVLVAVEEGTVGLDDPVGRPGVTVRHLLAHAGGESFDGATPAGLPGRRRIYSNTGYELLAETVTARSGIPFASYVREAIFDPLGMHASSSEGSAAKDFSASLPDLLRFVGELARPRLVSAATATAARTVQFPELSGIVPGIGRFDPCPWGLGPELRGAKWPHWMAPTTHAETFGHFGGSGTFAWVDPIADVAVAALTDRTFGEWAMNAWPTFGEAVLDAVAADRVTPAGASGPAS